jgi:hypothetical protein
MYARDEKVRIIDQVLAQFRRAFGYDPRAVGAYHLDAASLQGIKETLENQRTI